MMASLPFQTGNRLDALKGSLAGFHSIRINEYRISFKWKGLGAASVQILDYHKDGCAHPDCA